MPIACVGEPSPELLQYAQRQDSKPRETRQGEKRRHQRLPAAVRVAVQPLSYSLQPLGRPVVAVTSNISLLGMTLHAADWPGGILFGIQLAADGVKHHLLVKEKWCEWNDSFATIGVRVLRQFESSAS